MQVWQLNASWQLLPDSRISSPDWHRASTPSARSPVGEHGAQKTGWDVATPPESSCGPPRSSHWSPPPAPSSPLSIFEFGVAFGEATRWWLERIDSPLLRYHGFDRFTGLPQQWRGMPTGAFDAGGRAPAIDDTRVTWHVGDVENTLDDIDWAMVDGRRFFNFDLDLFRPSLAVWERIAPTLESGDILYFDEAYDSDERILLEAYVLPTGRFEGLGYSAFGLALIVK
jgi:hypothetical protein